MNRKEIIILTFIVLLIIFFMIMGIDSKPVNTNKEVDCIDGGDNFISESKCYKRIFCGEKFRFFNSKYCGKDFAFQGVDEE